MRAAFLNKLLHTGLRKCGTQRREGPSLGLLARIGPAWGFDVPIRLVLAGVVDCNTVDGEHVMHVVIVVVSAGFRGGGRVCGRRRLAPFASLGCSRAIHPHNRAVGKNPGRGNRARLSRYSELVIGRLEMTSALHATTLLP